MIKVLGLSPGPSIWLLENDAGGRRRMSHMFKPVSLDWQAQFGRGPKLLTSSCGR